MSLGVFEHYEQAQKAVDHLSDNRFPVHNVMIVGTDLKQVERVTGRLTMGKVLIGGALSGVWLGLFVAAIMWLFLPNADHLGRALSTVLMGAVFGLIWAGLGYSMTRGQRDFTSVSTVVATRYEVLAEHKVAAQAREILAGMGGGSASPAPPPTASV